MKKFRYLLLILLSVFVFIPSVSAADKEKPYCVRTPENNYGANKKDVTFTESNKAYAMTIPCVDPTKYVYDFGDVLSKEQEKKVAERMKEFEEKHHIAIMYYSFDYKYIYGEEKKVDDYAHDFYDLNDFGLDYDTYAGVYLWENAYKLGYDSDNDGVDDGFYYNAGSKGAAQLYFYDTRLDSSLDVIYDELKYGDKAAAIIRWVDKMDSYYDQGTLSGYDIDENGNLMKLYTPHYFIIFGGAAIITFIVVMVYIKKNKMIKKATEANDYIDKDTLEFSKREDKFLHSHTTSYTTSSSSSGGGHSSGGGSFSGGHSSGGGRH